MSDDWDALPWRQRWREVTRYQYKTVGGIELFQHVRWVTLHPSGIDPQTERPKTFTYRHYINGQSRIGLPDTLSEADKHLIYRLPDLARVARGQCRAGHTWAIEPTNPRGDPPLPPLVIAEGEKDVHALEAIGFAATTAHGGAMHGWGEPETEWLVRIGWHGDVWLAIDKDEAGWLHAQKALRALTTADFDLTCVVPREGKDAADAINTGLRGTDWCEPIDAIYVNARADRIARKLGIGTRGVGGGRLDGYLTTDKVIAWKAKRFAGDDW